MPSSKTLIGGTAYALKGGKTLVGGTAYKIKYGKTLVNSSAYKIPFVSDPIKIVDDGRSTPTWSFPTWAVFQSSGYLQWAAARYYCTYWTNNDSYAGLDVTITCNTTYDLSSLQSVNIRYSFGQQGGTNGITMYIGNYSTTLDINNWTYRTINCGPQTGNTIKFNYYVYQEVDQIIFALNELDLVFG